MRMFRLTRLVNSHPEFFPSNDTMIFDEVNQQWICHNSDEEDILIVSSSSNSSRHCMDDSFKGRNHIYSTYV
eukprot:Awhi_evm1s11819